MSSFRQYGGLNRAPTNNIVRNRYSNSDNPTISNFLGLYNSKIVSESHLDLSGNSLINVHGIYFDNGSTIIDGYLGGDLTVTGNLTVTKNTQLDGYLSVFGDVSLNSTLQVEGNSTFDGELIANGAATFNSTINDLYIQNIQNSNNFFITTKLLVSPRVTGSNNTGIGIDCMPSVTSGGTNACYGWLSGYELTMGQSNTLIGTQAGQNITTSSFNTALGYASGNFITTGASNTLIGVQSGTSITTTSNNTTLGYQSGYNITGENNTLIGTKAGFNISSGSFNTALGYNAYVNGNYSNSTAIGYSAQPTGDHQVVLGTVAETVIIDGSLNVHGDVSFNSTLEVGGVATFDASMVVYGDVSFNSTLEVAGTTKSSYFVSGSDYRIKTDVKPLDVTFAIDMLNPVVYKNKLSGKQDTGFIAHEVQEIFPHLVNGEKDGEETQTLNYQGLIAILTREIQELKKRVEILENK